MDSITEKLKSSYEEFPYEEMVHWKTHPDHLAAVAALGGLRTPDVESSRVLEIGCAAGSNLLPMVEFLPGARFLGIDLAQRQVEAGNKIVGELGLQNVELRCQDLMEFPDDAGEFDFIIAHGVYSWVPSQVRQRLLNVCHRHLSPNGVAYISYNAFPGWHYRQALRDAMRFRTRELKPGLERVARAREMAALVAEHCPHTGPLPGMLRAVEKEIAGLSNQSVAHDHMEAVNDPCYFSDFVSELRRHGLQYLQDAENEGDQWHRVPPAAQEAINKLTSDPIDREQYIDFVINRTFRSSVVCRQDATLHAPERLMQSLYIASDKPETNGVDAKGQAVVVFGAEPFKVNVKDAGVIAVIRQLKRSWPAAVSFAELAATMSQNSREFSSPPMATGALANLLLTYYRLELIELSARPKSGIAAVLPLRPRSTRYACWQAKHRSGVTTLRHRSLVLDAACCELVATLDGSRDVSGLADEIDRRIRDGGKSAWPAVGREKLGAMVESMLKLLMGSSLILGEV